MLRKMPSSQFIDWEVFAELEPFDEERADLRTGSVVAAIVNVHRNAKRKPNPYTSLEMAPKFGDTPSVAPRKASWQGMKAMAQMIAAGYSQ